MSLADWTSARRAYRTGDFEACERILRAAAERPEDRPYALYNLAVLYIDTRRPDWRSFYDEALELEPGLLKKIGARTLFRRDEYSGAVRKAKDPSLLDPLDDAFEPDADGELPPVEVVR